MVIEIKRNDPPKKSKKAHVISEIKDEDGEHKGFVTLTPPKPKRAPNGTFNRTEYQRLYMQAKREMALAGVTGMTVKQWRDSKR